MTMQDGSVGVWFFTERMTADEAAAFARRIESLGYSHLWLPEAIGRDPFAHAAYLLGVTERLRIATGIANIYNRHPGSMVQAAHTLAEQSGNRFLLGIGVSHRPLVEGLRGLKYGPPVTTMRRYLKDMAAAPCVAPAPSERPKVVLAALGPRMLELAGQEADGAHPYLTTPEHTAQARGILGPEALLCVEQKVCLENDAEIARTTARQALSIYMSLPNYRNSWLRLGFSAEEINESADRLIDALVAWGDLDAIRERIAAHQTAGATQVCIQPLKAGAPAGEVDWDLLEALAPGGS